MPRLYAIALGANLYRGGPPARTIARALKALGEDVAIRARSRITSSRPLGPGRRDFANAAAIIETDLAPPALLALAKRLERRFGRRPARRWGDRALDIDILLWTGGPWAGRDLIVPHPAFRARAFVLDPLAEIAPAWRDPVSGHTVAQLRHRLRSNSPVDRSGTRP